MPAYPPNVTVPNPNRNVQDAGVSLTTSVGISGARFTSADQHSAAANVTDAPASGQKLVITDIVVSADTTMRVDFREETTNVVLLSMYVLANTTQQVRPRGKLKLATANKHLQIITSVSGNVSATVLSYSEA